MIGILSLLPWTMDDVLCFNKKLRKKRHAIILPAHICPSPVNPGLHMHSKCPAVFIHVAFSWQNILLKTDWDLLTEKLCRKSSYANEFCESMERTMSFKSNKRDRPNQNRERWFYTRENVCNVSMYIINTCTIPHGKCFLRYLRTYAHSFDFWPRKFRRRALSMKYSFHLVKLLFLS